MRLSSSTLSSSPSTFLLRLLFPSQQHLRTTFLVLSRCVADRDAHTSWPCSGHRHLSGSLTCNVLVFHLVRCAAGCSLHCTCPQGRAKAEWLVGTGTAGQDIGVTRAVGNRGFCCSQRCFLVVSPHYFSTPFLPPSCRFALLTLWREENR